jgi:hypothetical protein
MDKVYTVIIDNDQLKCYDTSSGSLQGTYTFSGKVLNGPIVTSDRVTIVFETPTGKIGRIFKLPSFGTVSSFSIN